MSKSVELILRIGVAIAFLYPPVSAYLHPFSWIGFFPEFVRDAVGNDTLLLHTFGVGEIALAVWLLLGKKIVIPSSLAALALAGIVVFNWGAMEIVFRDISIFAMALALAWNEWTEADASHPLSKA